jgi:hypothetical protein
LKSFANAPTRSNRSKASLNNQALFGKNMESVMGWLRVAAEGPFQMISRQQV